MNNRFFSFKIKYTATFVVFIFLLLCICNVANAQNSYIITGKVTEASSKPMQNATVHLKGSPNSTLTKADGSFRFHTSKWYDSLEVTSVGFEPFTLNIKKNNTLNLSIIMIPKTERLQEVIVSISTKPGKAFMEKVIEQKDNNPSCFRSYSYLKYTRNELDIDKIDYEKQKAVESKV